MKQKNTLMITDDKITESFKYKGKSYYLLTESDHVAVCDSPFSEEYETS